jgi:hypothetical protein
MTLLRRSSLAFFLVARYIQRAVARHSTASETIQAVSVWSQPCRLTPQPGLLETQADGWIDPRGPERRHGARPHWETQISVFLPGGFHCLLATKPIRSETPQAERLSTGNSWFYLGLVAHSYVGLSEGA